MIDERTIELMHGEIHGTLSSEEIAELESDEGVDDQLSQLKARMKDDDAPSATVTDVNQNSAK